MLGADDRAAAVERRRRRVWVRPCWPRSSFWCARPSASSSRPGSAPSVRDRITWQPAVAIDATLGAAVSVSPCCWSPGSWPRRCAHGALGRRVPPDQHSHVLTRIDRVMPDRPATCFAAFRRVLDAERLPAGLRRPIGAERIRHGDRARPGARRTPRIRAAPRSIVKITGTADSCGTQLEGSGFVFAGASRDDQRARRRRCASNRACRSAASAAATTHGGAVRPAAVTSQCSTSPASTAPALKFAGERNRGDGAWWPGYPPSGPLPLEAARIRGTSRRPRAGHLPTAPGDPRDLLGLRGRRPGNSGGPLLRPNGGCTAWCSPRPSTTRTPATPLDRGRGGAGTCEGGPGPEVLESPPAPATECAAAHCRRQKGPNRASTWQPPAQVDLGDASRPSRSGARQPGPGRHPGRVEPGATASGRRE